jgi:hypothetical protein
LYNLTLELKANIDNASSPEAAPMVSAMVMICCCSGRGRGGGEEREGGGGGRREADIHARASEISLAL